jgi:hypothetical protein
VKPGGKGVPGGTISLGAESHKKSPLAVVSSTCGTKNRRGCKLDQDLRFLPSYRTVAACSLTRLRMDAARLDAIVGRECWLQNIRYDAKRSFRKLPIRHLNVRWRVNPRGYIGRRKCHLRRVIPRALGAANAFWNAVPDVIGGGRHLGRLNAQIADTHAVVDTASN